MMRNLLLAATAVLAASAPLQQAHAWMRGGGGGFEHARPSGETFRDPNGGYTHVGNAGGYDHATTVGPHGVSHESNYGGYAHGSEVGSNNTINSVHTTPNGNYNHQPAVVNSYSQTCNNCGGGGGWGAPAGAAVAAGVGGLAVGTMVGAAVANSANANANAYAAGAATANANAYAAGAAAGAAAASSAYAIGASYAALPGGCAYSPYNGSPYYRCSGAWMVPAYGANGVYYRVVPGP